MIDRMVGNYKLLEKLGEGGMGAVFRGVDIMVEREVAIKMLRPEIARQPEIVERFRSEAVTLAKLNHPGIATLFSFFRQGEEYFMVMEFVPGRTLDSLLGEFGPMPVDQAVAVFLKVLAGIEHAHQLGILHRDIKPANIMLTTAGAVKVTDFGIARIIGASRVTRQGNIVGTLEYIAPERIKGEEHDSRSDIYSLGAVLYEMLCGRLPFERDNEYALMQAHLMAPPPPLGQLGVNVPPEIEAIAARALAKRPEERFGSAGEFGAVLQAAWAQAQARIGRIARDPRAAGVPATAPPHPAASQSWALYGRTPAAGTPAPQAASGRPSWAVWAAVAMAVVLVAAFGIWLSLRMGAIGALRNPASKQPPSVVQELPARPADARGQTPAAPAKSVPAPRPQRSVGSTVSGPGPPQPQPIEAVPPKAVEATPAAPSDEERRRAALRALEQGSADAQAKEKERRRIEALKALQK